MKKLFTLFVLAGMMAFVACGPSAEEKAAAEKRVNDSIAAVKVQAKQDSIAKVEKAKQDSIAAAAEKAKQDSIAKAEEAKTKKGGKKATAPKPVEKKDVKAGQGKNAK